jgi:hypothetical protein
VNVPFLFALAQYDSRENLIRKLVSVTKAVGDVGGTMQEWINC